MKSLIRLFSLIALICTSCTSNCNTEDERAKYIFLFIGDGMGFTHIAAAESYLSYKVDKLGGEQLLMSSLPYIGTATTHSADRHITCSSAAGTAIACGVKAKNNTLGVDEYGMAATSVAMELKDSGYRIGLVTNVGINHATPAAFYAHCTDREDFYGISQQIPSSGFDMLGGSGFLDSKGADGTSEPIDIWLEKQGYTVCYGPEEFKSVSKDKDAAIFCQERYRGKDAVDYSPDIRKAEETPLAEIVGLAIEYLGDEDRFFIMCEGGTIDWTSHYNTTMPMIENLIEFDEAIKTAYDFYLKHKDETLIVVTSDHETGGITLGQGGKKTIRWDKLEKQWIESGKKYTLSDEENRKMNEECGIGWTTAAHTGGAVPVFAIGKGAEMFMGRMDNTDIKGKILGE